jgi:hypothetical protein
MANAANVYIFYNFWMGGFCMKVFKKVLTERSWSGGGCMFKKIAAVVVAGCVLVSFGLGEAAAAAREI